MSLSREQLEKYCAFDYEEVEIYEFWPEPATHDAKAYRVIRWYDQTEGAGIPTEEIYEASFSIHEDGDAENGPSCHLELGEWKQISAGIGWFHSPIESVLQTLDMREQAVEQPVG